MKKLIRTVLMAVSMLLAATECVDPVDIVKPENREVFVKCILEKGNAVQQVTLLYSGSIGDTQFDPVTEATVTIGSRTPKDRIYHFQHTHDGVYQCLMEPKAGETYVLSVSIPGRDIMEATTTMPPLLSLNSEFNPPEEWIQKELKEEYIMGNWYIYSDPWVTPWDPHCNPRVYEKMKKAGRTSLHSEMPGLVYRMDSLEHHHLYVMGRIETSSGPIASIRGLATNHRQVDNVNANGRLYQEDKDPASSDTARRPKYERILQRYYSDLPMHDNYLRIDFTRNYDNGLRNVQYLGGHEDNPPVMIDARRYFTVVGDFKYNIWGAYDHEKAHPVLYFCSVSEEYDKYLRSVQAALADTEGDLLASLYRESSGYSNVNGGFGVFGAMFTLRHDCDLQEVYDYSAHAIKATPYSPYPALLSVFSVNWDSTFYPEKASCQ